MNCQSIKGAEMQSRILLQKTRQSVITDAVSYTHLDVYKRQVIGSMLITLAVCVLIGFLMHVFLN